MRFLHLADLHLGKTLGDYNLIDDQKYILEQM
jgi:exonuclease SbcD